MAADEPFVGKLVVDGRELLLTSRDVGWLVSGVGWMISEATRKDPILDYEILYAKLRGVAGLHRSWGRRTSPH